MAPAPELTELIATVEADASAADPLSHLSTASATAAELTESADALVGHFVDRCRATGHTWAEISEALGVTKQAAHKRYTAGPSDYSLLTRFTDRARHVITGSVEAARELQHPFVGTEHILLALFPPGGIGATLLTESGLSKDIVTERVVTRIPRGDVPSPANVPYTPRASEVFSGALSEALSMGHNYIGTEHLLLALFRDGDGLAAQILSDAGASHASFKESVVRMLLAFMQK
jgi:hypothetical protein